MTPGGERDVRFLLLLLFELPSSSHIRYPKIIPFQISSYYDNVTTRTPVNTYLPLGPLLCQRNLNATCWNYKIAEYSVVIQ